MHQHQPGAVRGGHDERPQRDTGTPGRRPDPLSRVPAQMKQRNDDNQRDQQAARADLQRRAIHQQTERHCARNQHYRCDVPDRDRYQRSQHDRTIA